MTCIGSGFMAYKVYSVFFELKDTLYKLFEYDKKKNDLFFFAFSWVQINGVRMAINIAIGSEDTVASWAPDAVYRIQESARRKLLE